MTRLTKGQREFFTAVACGEPGNFHRMVIEPVEKMGLVLFVGGWRLVGCNSFSSSKFVLTEEGFDLASQMFERKAA